MVKLISAVSIALFISLSALAETQGAGAKASGYTTSNTLPNCIDKSEDIQAIQTKIKLNAKTEFKYEGYKKALASDSDEELMARLVYAETKAARCETSYDKVVPVITTVIANRIKIKKGDVKAVVYQRDQFASSLNIYSESNFRDFLCPNEMGLWNLALKESAYALHDKAKPTTTVNYFLYKHSPRWTKEPWTLEEDQALTSAAVKSCIRAFKNPNYK